MNNSLPSTLKYHLQTWSPEYWKTEYKGKRSEEIDEAITILKNLPAQSHLFGLAEKAINILSSVQQNETGSVYDQSPGFKEKQEQDSGKIPDSEVIMRCIENNDEDLGIALIEKGANIHTIGNDKKTALYHAIEKGQYQLADKLIEKGANYQQILENFSENKLLQLKNGISLIKEKKPNYNFSTIFQDRGIIFHIHNIRNDEKIDVLMKNLVHAGADPNASSRDGMTPLHMIRCPAMVKVLIESGANLQARNARGKSAFDLILAGNPVDKSYLLYLFLKQDLSLLETADLNEETLTDVMRFACKDNCEELALKLLEKGAKIDVPKSNKFTALDYALAQGHFGLIRTIIRQLDGSYKTFIEHKILAHVFGLDGFSDFGTFKVNHEGFNYSLSAQMLAVYGGMFLKENPEMKELFDAFQEAPDNCTCSPEELVKKIEAGKIVILFTGWGAHITALIFCNGYVLKCNRGAGRSEEGGGVEIFQMLDKENLQSVLYDLQRFSTSIEGKALFCTQINDRLKLKKTGAMVLKDQPTGNCGWSSAKAAFLGASYLYYLKQKIPASRALVEGMHLFKAFTPFVREKVFEYCISSTENLERF